MPDFQDKKRFSYFAHDLGQKWAGFVWFALLAIFLLVVTGWLGFSSVEKEHKENLKEWLETTVTANANALRSWVREKTLDAQVLVSHEEIRMHLISLLEQSKDPEINAEILLKLPDLLWLRDHLGEACLKYGYVGFVVLNSSGRQVGALLEEPVGQSALMKRSDFFSRSLKGETVLSVPFRGEVSLPDISGTVHEHWPTMFTSTPIINADGKIVGVLALRLRPEIHFTGIFEISRLGETMETYALNARGEMISNSRFMSVIKEIGLIQPKELNSIMNLEIRDPGGNMLKGFRPSSVELPWTHMAAEVVAGRSGFNVDGYRDYRGVPVVGAWMWLPEYQMGITTEIDVDEAFAPLRTLENVFWILLILLFVATSGALLFRYRELRRNIQIAQANAKAEINETKLRHVVEHLIDGMIVFDENGRILSMNPEAEKIFGWKAKEADGRSFEELFLPEHLRKRFWNILKNGAGLERMKQVQRLDGWSVVDRDGREFPVGMVVYSLIHSEETSYVVMVRDITQQKRSQFIVETQKEILEQMVNGAGIDQILGSVVGLLDGVIKNSKFSIWLVDPGGEQLRLNESVGWSEADIQSMSEIPIGPASPGACGRAAYFKKTIIVEDIRQDELAGEFGQVLLSKNVKSLVSSPITTSSGQVLGTFAVSFSKRHQPEAYELELIHMASNLVCTALERKQAEEELLHALKKADAASQAKTEFLSRMSHELRHPMNAILGFAQLLSMDEYDPLTDFQRSNIKEILNAGQHLLKMINEVLELSRIECGKVPVVHEDVSIAEVLEETLLLTQPLADKKSIRIVNRITGRLRYLVLGDHGRLKQVMLNLIFNAIKYIPEKGTVTLDFELFENGRIQVFVEDDGPGIPLQFHDQAFEPFNRLELSNSPIEGTGIGLSVCRKFLELMEGSIRLDPDYTGGCRFVIELKCSRHVENGSFGWEVPALARKAGSEQEKPKTVLCIEDNLANMRLLQLSLKRHPQINLLTASQTMIGLELAQAHKPDLILMDINLPGMDGFKAMDYLKNNVETHTIPVVALSASNLRQDINRALDAGFVNYITKPIDLESFFKTVYQALDYR